MNRRTFVKKSSFSVAGTFATALSSQSVVGANDRLRCGFVGVGGMGRSNLRDFLLCENVEAVAVCDVWRHNVDRAVGMTEGKAASCNDFRQVLDRKDIDVVVISTPDHWHGFMATAACRAGKDVYVEKPLAHNTHEGRKIVDAARANRRVVQVGTQQRSGLHYQRAVELIRSGKLGKISRVAAWNVENVSPHGIGNVADTNPPDGLDYGLWLGPAPKRPFNPNRFIYNFRYFWDYAGGHATDWGVHHLDIIQWAMGVKGPARVSAMGGKYFVQDNRETPDTLEVLYEYSGFLTTYTSRFLNASLVHDRPFGIVFYGTDATLILDRLGFEVVPEVIGRFQPPEAPYQEQLGSARPRAPQPGETPGIWPHRAQGLRGEGSEQHLTHVKNFLACVRSREKPAADVEDIHYSTATTHLANISYRTGRTIKWDVETEQIVGDKEAAGLLKRENREPWIVT